MVDLSSSFKDKKIAIFGGTGPIGMEIGTKLAKAGYDTTLIGRSKRVAEGEPVPGANIRALQKHGGVHLENPATRASKFKKFDENRVSITGNPISKWKEHEEKIANIIYRDKDVFVPFSDTFHASHSDDPSLAKSFDLVICAVKRNQRDMHKGLGKSIAAIARDDAPVLVLANGVDPLFLEDIKSERFRSDQGTQLHSLGFANDFVDAIGRNA